MTGGSTIASPMANSGENGWTVEPKAPKKTMIDTPAETIIEPKPTGLMA